MPIPPNNKNSFGIDRNTHLERLIPLLQALTDRINFLYTTPAKKVDEEEFYWKHPKDELKIIERYAAFLTTSDFTKESNSIYFSCETTTAAWILTIISKNFSEGQKLNPYSVGRSMKFYVCSYKRPKKNKVHIKKENFRVLTRDNMTQSLKRFKDKYSQDPKYPEYMDYKKAIKVFNHYGVACED